MDSIPGDWHFAHYAARAAGGAGLIIVEATAITPEGRISPGDLGIWSDEQARAFQRITRFIRQQGAVAGIQIPTRGGRAPRTFPGRAESLSERRKADGPSSRRAPFRFRRGTRCQGPCRKPIFATCSACTRARPGVAWRPASRSLRSTWRTATCFTSSYPTSRTSAPTPMAAPSRTGSGFRWKSRGRSARRGRTICRCSSGSRPRTGRREGGDLDQSIRLARALKEIGIDFIDCSSGGLVEDAVIPAGHGFQVPFAAAVREKAEIQTGAVGFITSPVQADQIVATGQADAVLLGRVLLRDPYWALHAARTLGADVRWPPQYLRGRV